MTELVGRPAYQQVADDLRQKMTSGELSVGTAIPSTAQMTRQYGVSSTVVRAAVSQLRTEGLLVGQPGKGVFVCAVPGTAGAVTLADLAKQVASLHETGSGDHAQATEIAALRNRVSAIERHLADLYQHVGMPLPGDLAAQMPDARHIGH